MLTQHLIDAVSHQFTPDPTEMQRIPDVYIAFDEKRQSLHQSHPVCLKKSTRVSQCAGQTLKRQAIKPQWNNDLDLWCARQTSISAK
jgi:hypothetical protein